MTATKLHTTTYYFELRGQNMFGDGNPARREIGIVIKDKSPIVSILIQTALKSIPQTIDQLNPVICKTYAYT